MEHFNNKGGCIMRMAKYMKKVGCGYKEEFQVFV